MGLDSVRSAHARKEKELQKDVAAEDDLKPRTFKRVSSRFKIDANPLRRGGSDSADVQKARAEATAAAFMPKTFKRMESRFDIGANPLRRGSENPHGKKTTANSKNSRRRTGGQRAAAMSRTPKTTQGAASKPKAKAGAAKKKGLGVLAGFAARRAAKEKLAASSRES